MRFPDGARHYRLLLDAGHAQLLQSATPIVVRAWHRRDVHRARACSRGDFRRCRPEPSGLREVYFRYDDELEYWAKANNLLPQMEQYSGTKTYGFPITVSALIDEQATLRGIRLVSDPRGDTQNRDEAYLLRNFLTARFGRSGWACESLPPQDGETPVSGIFVKESCRKQIDPETTASLATRHLRKAGQSQFDRHSGRETTGQFESMVRFELVRDR